MAPGRRAPEQHSRGNQVETNDDAISGASGDDETGPHQASIGEVHVDTHAQLTLRTYDHATAIQLGPLGAELTARMRTFDAAWAELTVAERTRATAIHLDARADQVTVALAPTKD